MATRAGLFLIVVLASVPVARDPRLELVVWNVGQGQWVTIVDDEACWHFDAGGEFAPWSRVRRACGDLPNRVTFSHWDSDHVGFAAKLARALPNACLLAGPVGAASPRKTALLARLAPCGSPRPWVTWIDDVARGSNARSRVSLWRDVLVPGDATVAQEKRFVGAFRALARARWLVLGHHGSQTSTSERLLRAMPLLKGAIASARRRRYGHPHAATRDRLSRFRVPLVGTEDWGDVHVAL